MNFKVSSGAQLSREPVHVIYLYVIYLYSALDKVLSNWVFWAIFTHPFLIELGIRIFPLCKMTWRPEESQINIDIRRLISLAANSMGC